MPTATSKSSNKNVNKSIDAENAELASLKEILFRDERDELVTLQQQIADSQLDEESLSEMLPGAIRASSGRDLSLIHI